VNGDTRPVLSKDLLAKGINLNELNGFKTAQPLRSHGKTTNPAEQVQVAKHDRS